MTEADIGGTGFTHQQRLEEREEKSFDSIGYDRKQVELEVLNALAEHGNDNEAVMSQLLTRLFLGFTGNAA